MCEREKGSKGRHIMQLTGSSCDNTYEYRIRIKQ